MGIPEGPKMGRKVPKWAESLLVFLVGPAQTRTIPNLGQSSNVVRNIFIQIFIDFLLVDGVGLSFLRFIASLAIAHSPLRIKII